MAYLKLVATLLVAPGVLGTGPLPDQRAERALAGPPPLELDSPGKRPARVFVSLPGIEGGVSYALREKKVRITWRRDFSAYLPEPNVPPSLSLDGGFPSIQEESVGFWPTEVCGFGPDRIAVAGQTIRGTATIQLWSFDTQTPLGDPYTDPSGRLRFPETFLPVSSKVTLLNGPAPGNDLVRTMWRNHGDPESLFVQFHGSRDVYRLDTVSGALSLAVSTAQVPQLSLDNEDRWSAHHQLGYFYALASANGTLLLFDSDLDGGLDLGDTRYLTGSQWYAGPVDFSDPAGYLEFY